MAEAPGPGTPTSKLDETAGAKPAKQYGVTEPISVNAAGPKDLELTAALQEALDRDVPPDTPERTALREEVLRDLEQAAQEWVKDEALEAGLGQEQAQAAGARILTFGSYRLGVVNWYSDIDAVVVAPSFTTREAFFSKFVERRVASHPKVSECTAVPDAYTPVAKLVMSGVPVDLLFAKLNMTAIPGDLAAVEDEHLKGVDEKSARSLNGTRVASLMLELVPDADAFRLALRMVKHWAKRRGIYSNVQGYFGGITWALLVARVCQLYPNYSASQLVNRFFRVFEKWNWKSAVRLCETQDLTHLPGFDAFTPWNPKVNVADKNAVMPVITPSFPAMNSTYNVTETSKRILLEEMNRGYKTLRKVEEGACKWADVYAQIEPWAVGAGGTPDFLVVEVSRKGSPGGGVEDPVLHKWQGWVESKLRILYKNMEGLRGVQLRPFPDPIVDATASPPTLSTLLGISFPQGGVAMEEMLIDFRPALHQFVEVLSTWPEDDAREGKVLMTVKFIRAEEIPPHWRAVQVDGKGALHASPKRKEGDVGESPAKRRKADGTPAASP